MKSTHKTLSLAFAITAAISFLAPQNAGAQILITPGFDLFATAPSPQSFVDIDLGGPIGIINVPLVGNPFGPGDTDSIVERKNGLVLPSDGDSGIIQVEMVALQLKSAAPVDIGGTLFDLDIISGSLLGEPPNPLGAMDVLRTGPTGGDLFLFDLPINFHAIFTDISLPANTFDVFGNVNFGSNGGAQNPQNVWSTLPGPMDQHDEAGLEPGGMYAGVDPLTQEKVIWAHVVPGEAHYINPAMPEPSRAILSLLGFAAVMARRRR